MRMRSAFGTAAGIVLLLVGVSILLNVLFGVSIPIVRLLLAGLSIYVGLLLLLGVFKLQLPGLSATDGTVSFRNGELRLSGDPIEPRELTVAFARGRVDLSELPAPEAGELCINLSVVFADAVVYYDPALPLCIEATSALGDCVMPDEDKVLLGTLRWRSATYEKDAPTVRLKVACILGQVRFVEKASSTTKHAAAQALPN